MWIALNFFPIGWPQLNAVFDRHVATTGHVSTMNPRASLVHSLRNFGNFLCRDDSIVLSF
jgi:hypothetical protein